MKTIADQSYYLSKTFEYVLLSLTVIEKKRQKWGLITVTIFRAALVWRVPYLPQGNNYFSPCFCQSVNNAGG